MGKYVPKKLRLGHLSHSVIFIQPKKATVFNTLYLNLSLFVVQAHLGQGI